MEERYGIRQGIEDLKDTLGGIALGGIILGIGIVALGASIPIAAAFSAYKFVVHNKRSANSPHKIKIPREIKKIVRDNFYEGKVEVILDSQRNLPAYQIRHTNGEHKVLAEVFTRVEDVDEMYDVFRHGPVEVVHYSTSAVFPDVKNRFGHFRLVNVEYDGNSTHRTALSIATKIADHLHVSVEDNSQGKLEERLSPEN